MLFLLLSVLSSTILVMVFKFFPKYGIDTFQAIVANYLVCIICGTLVLGRFPFGTETLSAPWLPYALGLGILFISGFYAVGMTVLFFGLTVASVLQKMSLVISVPFAIIAFSEPATPMKIAGILLALGAVVLSNWPAKKSNSKIIDLDNPKPSAKSAFLVWFFPLYAFLVSGAIECGLQYVQNSVIDSSGNDSAEFSSGIFASAAIIGLSVVLIQSFRGRQKFALKNLVAGFFLGVPNYFSIYFLLKAFDSLGDKSVVLPVNNITIVAISALLGVLFFSEKLSRINWLGVALSAIAIAAISIRF
jgi:drug/metabolite transporter (DMT)-like permease